MTDAELSLELNAAGRRAIEARTRLDALTPRSPEYEPAMLVYLQATVLHQAIVSVMQARQYEHLAHEVDALRAEMDVLRAGVH